MSKQNEIFIPENEIIPEHGYMTINQISLLLKRYKEVPNAIQFIADMIEK